MKKQKHMDESWVVKANRERDRISQEESRKQWEELQEEFHKRILADQKRDPGWFPVPPGMYELTDDQIAGLGEDDKRGGVEA